MLSRVAYSSACLLSSKWVRSDASLIYSQPSRKGHFQRFFFPTVFKICFVFLYKFSIALLFFKLNRNLWLIIAWMSIKFFSLMDAFLRQQWNSYILFSFPFINLPRIHPEPVSWIHIFLNFLSGITTWICIRSVLYSLVTNLLNLWICKVNLRVQIKTQIEIHCCACLWSRSL